LNLKEIIRNIARRILLVASVETDTASNLQFKDRERKTLKWTVNAQNNTFASPDTQAPML